MNDVPKTTCRRCGGNLRITTISCGRQYEKCANCHFQYPVITA